MDTKTINTGESCTYDGVIYTATSDAVLNLDDSEKVSGISSGSVVAKLSDSDSSPEITFDGSTAFDFSCSPWKSALGTEAIQVKASGATINYSSGQVTYKADGISAAGDISLAGAIAKLLPFDVAINVPDSGMKIAFDENNLVTFNASEKVNAALTFPEGIATLVENFKPLLGVLLKVDEDTVNKIYDIVYKLVTSPTTAQLDGEFSWHKDNKTLGITKDSNLALNVLDYSLSLAAENGNVDGISLFFKLTGEDVALGTRFTPSTDENASLHFTAAENNSQIYDGLINVTSGAIDLDIINANISAEKDTTVTITQGDYSSKLTFNNAASVTFNADAEGILYYNFGEGAGSLDFTLYNGDNECISGNVKTNGAFTVDTENKIVGVTQGTTTTITIGDYVLTATANENTTANIAFKDDGISFTTNDTGGAFNLLLKQGDATLFDGALKITGGSGSFNPTTQKFSFTEGSEVSITVSQMQYDFKVVGGDASLKVEAQSGGRFIITPDEKDGSLDIVIKKVNGNSSATIAEEYYTTLNTTNDAATAFYSNVSISNGSVILDDMGQAIGLTAGTTINVTLGNYVIAATTTDEVRFKLGVLSDGSVEITPQDNGNAFDVSIIRDGTSIFSNSVNVSNGTIIFNPTTQAITLTDGTTVSLAFNNYTLTATASGDATTTFSLTTNGIVIAPTAGDGTLNLTLGGAGGAMNANIEVLSGSFILGQGGALTVAKDTELKIDFGNGYIINFKATDAAGGAISLGADGLTFAPNSDDGGLELSITRDGETRTASLDVTGSLTYKLDGSISLTQGTVVKNVFDSGNILTITANTDASGSMIFTPNNGLTITPSTPDALTATLTTGDLEVAKFTSIDGTINYSGGVVTATDGTTANLRVYDTWETKLSTTGGTASIQFTGDRTVYTANDGATFVLDYLDGSTVEIQNGSFSDIYATETSDAIELISEGSTFRCNDNEFTFTLETAGNYTLNGLDVTTTADGVQVVLSDYNTVILTQGAKINFATTLSGSPLDVTATATQGQASVTLDDDGNITYDATDATLQLTIGLEEVIGESILPNVFTISGGSVTVGATDADGLKSISIKAGTELSFTQNDTTFKGVVQNDINGRLWMRDGAVLYLHSYDDAIFDTTATLSDGKEVFKGTVTLDGAFSYSAERGTVGAVDSNTYNVHDSSIQITVGNQTLKFTTNGDTFFAVLSTDGNGKLTFDFNNDKYNSMLLAIVRDGNEIYNAIIKISGPIVLDPANSQISIAEDTSFSIVRDDRVITLTADKDISTTYKVEEGIYYFTLDDGAAANISVTSGEQTIFAGGLTAGGVLSFNPTTGTFGLTGANSSHGNGTNTFAELTTANGYGIKLATADTTVVFIPTITDGKFELNFPNENKHEMAFTLSKDGQTIFEHQIIVDGTIGFDIASQELHLTKDTALNLSGDGGENWLKITALDDVSGQLQFTDSGIRFAPNAGDGQLELNFVGTDRKANIDVSAGAIILGNDGMMSLEKDTVLTLTWEDGTTLKMTASDTGGSIGFDGQGLKISSDGEISIDLTTATGVQTTMSNLEGSIHYNAGKILFDENSTLTATSSLGGLPTNITLVSNGTGGYIEISATGTRYVAGTGAFQNTWSRDGRQSTFAFSDGEIFIGHGIFQVSEGISLSTDLQDLVPTLYFTTTDAGTYTVNGQTITTSAENLLITAIDDYMYFTTGDNAVTYNGMTFTGDGTITISNSGAVNCDATNATLQISIPLGSIIGETVLPSTFDISGGTVTFDSPNNKITCGAGTTFSFTQAGQTITLTTSKDINIDINNTGSGFIQEISLDKDTVLTLTVGETTLKATALDDAGGQLSFIDGGIRFAPNENDGALELNFVSAGRKANLNVTGAVILLNDGKISLEDGTEVNLDWEDGTNLKLNSHGSTGSIAFGEKGIRIASEDENLDMTLTTPDDYSATITSIQGAVWYNAGTVTLDANTSMTGKNIVEGHAIGIKVDAIDGDASLTFSNVGFTYNANDGKTRVTYTLGDAESSFTLNKGSVFIQGRVFHIAEGSDLATDFKDFIPVQYFQTQEAGTYTINGQTITTSAANLSLMATDDYMSFTTSDNIVEYDGMIFAGAGNVSLTANSVVLGAGVVANGFGLDKSFVLAEAGNVTADARIFELTELDTSIKIPMEITVTGAQDGFIFSRTLTKESEAYLDDALNEKDFGNYSSSYIGQVFKEKFIAEGDSSYRIRTDAIGLEEVIGISKDTTVTGGASLNDEPTLSYYNLVTDTEGTFTIGEKAYNVSGDSSVAITARFGADGSAYASAFDSLNGTVSGDFNDHAVTVNGGVPIVVKGDKVIDIVADESGHEVFGISDGESLVASLSGIYTVNGKAIELIEDIPLGITVTGAQNGFTFASTLTEEAVQRADKDASLIGKVFTEHFTSSDDTFSVQAELRGLLKVTGIEGDTTINGGADIDGAANEHTIYIVTESDGTFTVADKAYTIGGDSEVTIKTYFDTLGTGAAIGFDGLSGTVSGNFNDGDFSVNGGESILISGDSSIDLVAGAKGIELFNVTGGVSLIEMGGVSKVHTDTEGIFTFGNGKNDTLAITIQGDDNVTFELNDAQVVAGITNIEGDIFFSETNASLSINGISGTFSGEFSSIGAYSSALYIHDATDGSAFLTVDEDKIWLQLRGGSFALNDNSLTLTNDADGIWLRDKEIVGLDEGASLKVSEAGNYIANETSLKAKADDIIVGLKDSAYIYDPNNPLITKNTPTDEIIQQMTDGDSSAVTVASSKENISLSGGGLVIVEDTSAKVNITASKGNDTIVSKGENVHIKLNSTGKTDLFATGGRMTLEGYDDTTGTGFGTNYGDIFDAISDGAINFDKGKFTIDSAVVHFDKDSEIINFFDATGELQKVGYAAGDDSLNASKQTADLILFAEKYSTITGGAGNDSIFADASSFIDAGAGKNYIEIETLRGANDDGTTIALTGGKNTITNFTAGFDDTSDRLFVGVNDTVDFKFDGTELKFYTNDELRGIVSDIADGAPFVNFLLADATSTSKIVAVQKGETVTVEDEIADYYRGEKSGVDFTNYEENLYVNLGSEEQSIGTGEVLFDGINQVTVGSGQNTLISSSRNETLTGNADGTTEFIFSKDSGRDLVQNFNFDNDKISVGNETITAVNINSAGGVRMEISGDAVLTFNDAQGKNFKINNFVALVDKNLTYNDAANYFVATSNNASLTVGEGAQIWLDGSHGKYFVGDIRTLDASTSTGKAELAGNDTDNRIYAGDGDSSLWGGTGGDDLLVGGAGKNAFFYTNGNGSDTIGGTNAGDLVYLSEITLEQIASTNVTNNVATINFKDGGRLTINDAANCDYVLTQGDQAQIYKVNESGFVNA